MSIDRALARLRWGRGGGGLARAGEGGGRHRLLHAHLEGPGGPAADALDVADARGGRVVADHRRNAAEDERLHVIAAERDLLPLVVKPDVAELDDGGHAERGVEDVDRVPALHAARNARG